MPLPDAQLSTLKDLLKECSAELVGETSRGTGYFIDDHLILTCSHVAGKEVGAKVEVHTFGRKSRAGEIIECLPDTTVDLALVTIAPDDEPQPSVLIDREIGDNIDYFAVGYPQERFTEGHGIEVIEYSGHRRVANDGVTVEYLKLDVGKGGIKPGLSGGAILSADTGAVVGLMQSSEAASGIAGGGAIPITRAAARFETVAGILDDPPISTRRWRETLGERAWRALGKPASWRRHLDLWLSGDRRQWTVRIDGKVDREFTVNRLPDENAEAVFRWAQRNSIRDEDDIQLLGKLLAGALFPDEIEARIRREGLADELVIRLHIDAESELFDVPWEFATVELEESRCHIGAHKRLGLVRVADQPTSASPPTKTARVVAAVLQANDDDTAVPTVTSSGLQVTTAGKIMKDLEAALSDARFDLRPLSDPVPGEMMSALTDPPPANSDRNAIVHYIGRGQVYDGKPCLSLSNGQGDFDWHEIQAVCGWVAQSGAQLLVVEFTPPSPGSEPDLVPPRTFIKALDGGVEAVLFTRFPVHPHHLWGFNKALYESLGKGETVETAVQKARTDTFVNRFGGKVTEFGWFTLITRNSPDMRIVEPSEEEAIAEPGVPRQRGRPAPSDQSSPAEKSPDEFKPVSA